MSNSKEGIRENGGCNTGKQRISWSEVWFTIFWAMRAGVGARPEEASTRAGPKRLAFPGTDGISFHRRNGSSIGGFTDAGRCIHTTHTPDSSSRK